jgi:amino acid transporter
VSERTTGRLRANLGAVDFTLLVVGAVIGADVYVVSAMGARFLGPAQLVAWLVAGVLAALTALAFVQCSAILPKVGGTYAYTREAFGPLAGFLAGWALYLGEWVALPVFPLAFANYFLYFIADAPAALGVVVKVVLIGAVTAVNIRGIQMGARLNDALTVAKLIPLALLILAGFTVLITHPAMAVERTSPFAPLGWSGLGSAVLLIFWAYAGYELAVLPASEVREPRRTLPLGLIVGMAIATVFYLLTAGTVVLALPSDVAAASARPLADALAALLPNIDLPGTIGGVVMSAGALVSIAGVYDVFTLSLARLSYAMAADGLFPTPFAKIHRRYRTPYLGLVFQALCALVGSLFFDLQSLIAISVFFLGLCYVATAASALRLVQREPARRLDIPALRPALVLAVISGAYLSLQAPPPLLVVGVAAMLVGFGAYLLRRGGWREGTKLLTRLEDDERLLTLWAARRERWLLDWRRDHGSGFR